MRSGQFTNGLTTWISSKLRLHQSLTTSGVLPSIPIAELLQGTTDEGIQKTTSLLQKKELSTNRHKPFGLARIEGSFAKYLQTPHYMKLHLQAVIRAEISGNDPRPKLTSPSLSQVPNRLGMIGKDSLHKRTFSDQLDSPTPFPTKLFCTNYHSPNARVNWPRHLGTKTSVVSVETISQCPPETKL